MKHKRQVPYHQYIISLVCVAILAVGGSYIYFDKKLQKQLSTVGISSEDRELNKVQQLYDEITTNYVGKVNKKELIEGALKGMTQALKDPYSDYLNTAESKGLSDSLSGSFEGIGASMSIVDDFPTVAQPPIKGSPAEKSGLKVDDKIIKVDGKNVKGQELSETVKKVRGKKGTAVTLTIQRGKETFDVKVVRDVIPVHTVKGELDKENKEIGVINITSFGQNTYKELKETIISLRKEGAKSFILDLRGNPGGLLDQVEQMASVFLKNDQIIVQFEDKKGNKMKDVASKKLDGGFKVKEPVVVLVDENSASASEIFAAALKESAGKVVIGNKTFGKGTVQTVKDLKDDSEIKLTVLKWLTPNGTWINQKGLEPTIKVTYPEYAYLQPISREEILKVGSHNISVKTVNAILNVLEYNTDNLSQEFSETTKEAVLSFQKKNKLAETGEVDEKTANVLELALMKKLKENDSAYKKGLEELKKEMKK